MVANTLTRSFKHFCRLTIGCLILLGLLVFAFLRYQKYAIIGYWQNPDDSVVIEFRSDGTFRTRDMKPDQPDGRYSFVGFHKLKMELPGLHARSDVLKVSVGSDEITIHGIFPLALHRVDASKMIPTTPEQEIKQYLQDKDRDRSNQGALFFQKLTNR